MMDDLPPDRPSAPPDESAALKREGDPKSGPPGRPGGPARLRTRLQIAEASQFSFSGPIPPPDLIAAYDKILPGSADRIFRMAEAQAQHRQTLENRVILGDAARADRGLLF